MRILSVDDKPENLYMIEALLRGHGHTVDSASNGAEALQMAAHGGYDLIVSDILMPRMDGFQLCRELKHDAQLRDVPFVFYTATYTDARDASFALSLGADRFLIKPLEPDIFVKILEEVVNRKTPSPPQAAGEEPEDEAIYLKQYNARLISKLEKKMLDLEAANRALREDIAERERAAVERARLEEKLRQAQKLEAIGTLAGGIAHDFNNVLGGILGYADIGLTECADADASARNFREILGAAKRARDIVRQILSFSRQRAADRKPLDLADDVRDALRLLRPTLPPTVELVSTFQPDTPKVLAEGTQVHQAVTNLVTNAWHALGEKPGVIRVQIAPFQVDAEFAGTHPDLRAGPYARLVVSDNGRGMDAGVRERIFEPFFTTKEPGKGTGLGLSVVHGMMKSLDGAITVYSKVGEGTTFQLYFPAVDFDAPPPAVQPALLVTGHGERILFIDDESVLATVGERFLTRLGYAPTVQTDPARALVLFAQQPFDVVITDLSMPHITGVELARRIWEINPGARVILSTGYSATLDTTRARNLGFRELLLKPYSAQALGECVQRALAD